MKYQFARFILVELAAPTSSHLPLPFGTDVRFDIWATIWAHPVKHPILARRSLTRVEGETPNGLNLMKKCVLTGKGQLLGILGTCFFFLKSVFVW